MDVLHVIHQFPPESHGGSESYLYDLAQCQRRQGRVVAVLSGSKEKREKLALDSGEVDGLPVHRLHRDDDYFDHHAKLWHVGVEQTFRQLLERWRPRLLHVHHWVRLTCNLVQVAAAYGTPAVVTLHDYYTSCPRAFRRRADDAACRRPLSGASCGDCVPRYGYEPAEEIHAGIELFRDHYRAELSAARAVVVATAATADLLAASTGVPRDRYTVLPLGYQPRFTDLPPLAAPAPGEPLRFAFWGGMGRHKGVDVLLRAFRRLCAARPGRAALHLLGGAESDAFAAELRQLAEGLPVTMHGPFTAPQLHAAAPHVGVFPSTCIETWGLVLDECFELRRPCVVSDLGALGDRAGGGGLRAPAGDEAALAAALQRFVDEPGLWAELRARAPAPAGGLDAHVAALDQVYARALAGPAPVPFEPPVPLARTVGFLQLQRDSAMGRLAGPGGPR